MGWFTKPWGLQPSHPIWHFAGEQVSPACSLWLYNWLVVWNMNFIFPYIGNNHPNWLSYFSEGWLNHQPEKDEYGPAHCPSDPSAWIYGYFWHEQNHQNQTLSNGIGNLSLKLHEDMCAWLKNAWLQYVTVFWLLQLWLDGYYSYI